MNKQTKKMEFPAHVDRPDSGKMEYDYSALASTISEIVIKHYFAD